MKMKCYTIILGEVCGQGSPYDRVIGEYVVVGRKEVRKVLKEIKQTQFGFENLPVEKTLKKLSWREMEVNQDSFGNLNYSGYWLEIEKDILEGEVVKEKYEGWW